jgi:hypothetical protein
MSDLPRDPDSDWSEEELLLLRSADDDRPSSRSLAATLAGVGIGAAAGAAATAASASVSVTAPALRGGASMAPASAASTTAAKWGGAIAISKWVSVVALGATVAVSGIALERHVSQPPRAPARSTPQHPASSKPRVVVSTNEPSVAPAPSPNAAAEEPGGAMPALRPARVVASKRNAVVPAQPDLSREIAAIDEARSALRLGHASEALVVLDRYEMELAKSGALQLEAAALRIEVLFRLGDRGRARSLADAFLAKHPQSPYAARIRALVAAEATQR